MSNIIQLREVLNFGKHRGVTGAELLKSEEGTDYLVWAYNRTDIRMEDCVVRSLVNAALVEENLERKNCREHCDEF